MILRVQNLHTQFLFSFLFVLTKFYLWFRLVPEPPVSHGLKNPLVRVAVQIAPGAPPRFYAMVRRRSIGGGGLCPETDLPRVGEGWKADVGFEFTDGGAHLLRGPQRQTGSVRSRPLDEDSRSALLEEATQPLSVTPAPNADITGPEPAPVEDRSTERPVQFSNAHEPRQCASFHDADMGVPVRAEVWIAECVCL